MKIKDPIKSFKYFFDKINKNDIFSIIIVILLGVINNFSFITNEGIAPDALSPAYFNIAGNWEISLGRFGIKFVNMLRFGLVNKTIIVLIALIMLAVSAVIIIRTFEIKNKIGIFFISALIAVAPTFTETYMFIYCADAYCLAFLLSTLSVYFLNKSNRGKQYYIFSNICTIAVCSLYQAYLGVILGETIILLMKDLLKEKDIKANFIKAIKFFINIFIGILMYYILLKIIISILDISLASYKGANNLGIYTLKSLPHTIVQTYKDFINFFFTDKIINNSYWNREIINGTIFFTSFLGLFLILIKSKQKNKCIRALFLGVLILLYPIGIAIMDIIAPNTSLNLVTGPGLITAVILITLIYESMDDKSLENILRYIFLILMIILIFTFVLENTFTYVARNQTFRNYYTISMDIYSRAVQLEGYSKDKEWMFSDVIRFKVRDANRANGFISDDNVTWNNYNGTLQNSSFYEKYLGIKIKICSKEKYREIVETEEFKNMPIYPTNGSIKIINNVVVIKTTDNTF